MKADRMRLEPSAFGFAAGIVTAVLYTLCALAVALSPGATAAAFSYVLHLDLTGIARPITFGSYIGGAICMSLGVGLVFGAAAGLYNRIIGGFAPVARVDAAAHRSA